MPDPAKVRKNLGLRIRSLREQKGWSQWQMEQKTGVPRTFTSAIERGLRYVSVSTLCKYASAFDVNLSDLFTDAISSSSSSKKKTKLTARKTR